MIYQVKSAKVKDNLIGYIRGLPDDQGYVVRVEQPKKTVAQRNYFHNLLQIIAKDQGESPDALKDKLKLEWLPLLKVTTHTGKTYLIPKHTEDLSKEDYSILISKIVALAGFLGIVLPDMRHFGLNE